MREPNPVRRVLSLRQTLMLGAALSILLPALALAYFQFSAKRENEINLRVRVPMQQYADVLSRGMAVAIWNLDHGVASELVDAVMRNPDVLSVTVTDEFDEVFVRKSNDVFFNETPLREQRVITYNGTRVGSLIIDMSASRIEDELRSDLNFFAAALVAQVGISIVFIYLLVNARVLWPLQQLREGVARLARGQLDEPVRGSRKDEIGQLAVAMDSMRLDWRKLVDERDLKNQALLTELAERQRAERALGYSQTKFAAIFDASPSAMSVSDAKAAYQVLDVNVAWVRVFGWQRQDVVGSDGKDVALWKSAQARQAVLAVLERDGEISGHRAWMVRGDGGQEMLCEISGKIFEVGDESLLVLAFDDITATHQHAEAILQLNAGLENRVTQRTQELRDTLAQLTAAQSELIRTEKMSALGSLVAGIAHELNTPIGNSLTVASTLQDHATAFAAEAGKGLTRSKLDEFVNSTLQGAGILMRGLQHAAELVSSFKQVAVDQTSLNRRPFGLNETVDEILLTLGPTLRKTTHRVQCDIDSGIVMDSYPGPLGQVLTNLINNALLHAFEKREHGTVTVVARTEGRAMVRFSVCDDGVGIPAGNLSRVFDPFFTTKLGQGGSGLGLNIVYNLVTKSLGGTVTVVSQPGEGATFSMLLPLRAPDAQGE